MWILAIILFTTSVRASFPHCALVSVPVFLSPEANPNQNEKNTNFLGSFFEGGRFNDEMAEENRTANKKKATFKIKYQEPYLNYRFIATGSPHASSLLCIICSGWLSKEAMTSSKLLCHMETEYSALRDKPLEFFKRKKNVSMKNRSNYWRPPLHQMCLHSEHHF